MTGLFRQLVAIAIYSLCGAALFLVLSTSLSAQHSPIKDCNNLFFGLSRSAFDSSVEIEIRASDEVMRLFTTQDGTLGPVLGKAGLPEDLANKLKRLYPKQRQLKDLLWSQLTTRDQRSLIMHVAKETKHQFFSNRSVPGLVYKDKIELNFRQRTRFLGKDFKPGKHLISSKEVFAETPVQFMGPDHVTQNLGFELHLRGARSAGQVFLDARSLAAGLNMKAGNLHQHVVAPIPLEEIRANPVLTATRLAEFYRRVNLYTEMENILAGFPITMNQETTRRSVITNFGNMKPSKLKSVFNYFVRGAVDKLGDANKIAWVGMRGADKYDHPTKALWGLEFRDLSPLYDQARLANMLDVIQQSMVEGNYGIPSEKMGRWLDQVAKINEKPGMLNRLTDFFFRARGKKLQHQHQISKSRSKVLETWYLDRNVRWKDLSPELQKLLGDDKAWRSRFESRFADVRENNLAINYLTKNWSEDPLLFENPEVQKKVLEVQAQAIKRFVSGESHQSVLNYFIKRSGLHYMYEKSLGIP